MRRLTIAAVILISMVLTALYVGRTVDSMTQACITQLEQAQQFAGEDQWEKARTLTNRAWQGWDKNKFQIYVLLRHSELDQILISFRAVEQYLALEEMDQYAAANATLITQLELLSETEEPSLENVL